MLRRWIVLATLASSLAFGQRTNSKFAFEAASVKRSNPDSGPFAITLGGPGTKDPGRIRYTNMPLKHLLVLACGVNDFQIEGPGWMENERFDIVATMPADTTRDQFREMLRNLLVERFKIALHRETKNSRAYTLVAGRNGPTLAESAPAFTPLEPPPQLERDRDGFPKIPPDGQPRMLQFVVLNRARLAGRQQTMSDLAKRLSELLGQPVEDGTALTGKYDFTLTFATEGTTLGKAGAPPPPSGIIPPSVAEGETPPDLFSVLQSELGLKLEAKRVPVEVLVIDRAEKTPVAN